MGRVWTQQENFLLRASYGRIEARELCPILNCSRSAIYRQQGKLGLINGEGLLYRGTNRCFRDLNPYEELIEAERGYIAAIIDGEGWIGLDKKSSHNRNYPSYLIAVVNTNKDVIDWLKSKVLFSGNYIRLRKEKNHQDQYIWVLGGYIKVRALLSVLLPYLIIKKDKAEEVLQ